MKREIIGTLERSRTLLAIALTASLLAFSSCSAWSRDTPPLRPGSLVPTPPSAEVDSDAAGAGHTIVLVAIDGVRAEDLFNGIDRRIARDQGMRDDELIEPRALAPNLHELADTGAALGIPGHGAGMVASGPNFVSLPGYLEMLTGRRPTGCESNGCEPVSVRTLADDFAERSRPDEVAVIASWEGIERAASRDPSRLIVSVGRTHGLTRDRLRYDPQASALIDLGERSGPDPGHSDFRRDAVTAAIALRYLATHRPRFLFLGLGEADEYAHRDDYREYLRAISRSDRIVGEVRAVLGRLAKRGRRTTLLVTTDHGRSHGFTGHGGWAPESSRVWLVAAGSGIRARGPLASQRVRHLADVAATVRLIGGVGALEQSSEPLTELLLPAAVSVADRR